MWRSEAKPTKKLFFNRWGPCIRCFRNAWGEGWIHYECFDGLSVKALKNGKLSKSTKARKGTICENCGAFLRGTLSPIFQVDLDQIWESS